MGPERDELHEDLSGTIPTVTFQKLVKDPHNRRITEGEPKGNRRGTEGEPKGNENPPKLATLGTEGKTRITEE